MPETEEEVVKGIEKVLGKLSEEENRKRFKKWNKTVAFSFKEFDKTWTTTLTSGLPSDLEAGSIDKSKKYDILLITNSKTWLGILNKEVKAMSAFSSGDLKIKGKMVDLLKLRKVL
ncbi:MAG: SCP2 sterol-binding domain-containing protein [Candidatus Hodarchaeales archaeon]